jgi:YVTN family beta-propeller protein
MRIRGFLSIDLGCGRAKTAAVPSEDPRNSLGAVEPWLDPAVKFGVLGPVEVRADGAEPRLGGPKPRALLAMLLLHANSVVARGTLIDGLWGERAPPSAGHTLDDYLSRLRKELGGDRITTRSPGYMLRVEPGELDLAEFERLVERGRESSADGRPRDAAAAFQAALALWRGPALADVLDAPFAHGEAMRLDDQRLAAREDLFEAALACGRSAEIVGELERLVAEEPLRERPLRLLMLALYRSGRQAAALDAFRTAQVRLADELGLDPGSQLRKLEHQILTQDPSLDVPRAAGIGAPPVHARSGRRLVAAGLAVVLAACATIAIVATLGGKDPPRVAAATTQIVSLSSGSGALDQAIAVPGAPAAIAARAGSLWFADPNAGSIVHVDAASQAIVGRVAVGGSPGTLAIGGGFVWAASVPGDEIVRIDPRTETRTQTIPLGGARVTALAFGLGGLWIADATGNSLIELDPTTGDIRRTVRLHLRPSALAIGKRTIWVADYEANSIAEVDVRSGDPLQTVHVGSGPASLVVAGGAIWVANSLDSTVSKVDPSSGSVLATIPVGSGPTALAVAGASIWVANHYSGTLSRIDRQRNMVTRTVPLAGRPTALAATAGRLWAGTKPQSQRRGGTLTLLHTRALSIDPALQLDIPPLQTEGLTRDGLVTFNKVAGPAGTQLVPDLALSVPAPTDGGTTYTFRLRAGIRYSNGQPVRASDFRRAIERVFRLRSEGSAYFVGIVGGTTCADATTRCDLSRGIATDDVARTVTFHLRAPDPSFLFAICSSLATPVPLGTPFHTIGFRPIPGTGPYKIASASPAGIHYVRNPYFREWSHAAQPDGNPDRIVWRFGLSAAQEVREIEQGHADWMADGVPGALLPEIETRFAGQFHSYTNTETDFLQINTTRPPFTDRRVRQALNLAIDRRLIARLYGGPGVASPTCQVIPPGLLGYRTYCPYTRAPDARNIWVAPDFARAQRLVASSGTQGARVTVWGWTDDATMSPDISRHTAAVLRRLGYRATVRLISHTSFDRLPPSVLKSVQIIPTAWLDASAYNFFAVWLSCGGAGDHGYFCVPRIDRQVQAAQALAATNPRAAAAVWAAIDREIVDRAAWVPLVNPRASEFVSARIRNFQHHPLWGMIASQVSLT